MNHDRILIVDYGSQYTQLITRRVRELNVYSEIFPYNLTLAIPPSGKIFNLMKLKVEFLLVLKL